MTLPCWFTEDSQFWLHQILSQKCQPSDLPPTIFEWFVFAALLIEVEGQPQKVLLNLGDAVFYRGTKDEHWRNPLPENHTYTVCLYHFVGKDFKGSLT